MFQDVLKAKIGRSHRSISESSMFVRPMLSSNYPPGPAQSIPVLDDSKFSFNLT